MEGSGGSTGGSRIPGVTAFVLAAVGIVVLAAALWALATSLPDVLGAEGAHMAGDAKLYVAIVIVPLAVLAFLLTAAAWMLVRRRRSGRLAALAVALAGGMVVASAGSLALPTLPPTALMPAGAQQVRVVVTGGALTLTPATLTSGPVYLLTDASAANILFIGRAYATQAEIDAYRGHEPGPLSDAEVDAIARGDMYLTSTTAGLGEVTRLDLLPGKYVVVTDDPIQLASRGGGRAPAGTFAVLTVAE